MGKVVRPSYAKITAANGLAFIAFGAGLVTWHLYPPPGAHWMQWAVFVCAFPVTLRLVVRAIRAFHDDYRQRKAWEKAQRPSTQKHDGRWATYEEMAEAGMYDGVGRLLGTDMEGRLLFEPHRLKPIFFVFSWGPRLRQNLNAGHRLGCALTAFKKAAPGA